MSNDADSSLEKTALLLGVGLAACALLGLLFVRAGSTPLPAPPPYERARPMEPGPPLDLPFSSSAPVDLVASRTIGLLGRVPKSTAPPMWRGTAWISAKGAGFGRHAPKAMHVLSGGAWMLVHAESGLWFVETGSLARRARLRTGALAAVDVSSDGSLIAYAECEFPRNWGLRPNASGGPCDLVVLRFPALEEVRRVPVPTPIQIKLDRDARAIAVSRGGYGPATVVPLDPGQSPWSCHSLNSSVAAVPVGEARVAYMSDGGRIVIEERDRREALYVGRHDDPAIDFPITIRFVRQSGKLYYDAAGDRVLEPGMTDARVVEGALGPSPRSGRSITWSEFAASGVTKPRVVDVSLDELMKRFGLRSRKDWGLGKIDDLVFGPKGEALGLSEGYVIRIDREGLARGLDFGPAEDRWNESVSPFDMVFWLHESHRVTLWRVPRGAPVLDATPEELGTFENHRDRDPLLFPGGDRAFLVTDEGERAGVIRLPQGGKIAAVEWLPEQSPSFMDVPTQGENRYAFTNKDGVLVEIDPQRTRVLDRSVQWDEQLSWDEKKNCWALKSFRKKRFVGEGCQ